MDKKNIEELLDKQDFKSLRKALCLIIGTYTNPSFGSMSKHDVDLLLFDSMISLGIISKPLTIYNVMKDLKVTRTKARNLIYEHQLRKVENEDQLSFQLREILKTPLMSRLSKDVCLEIDNPYLIDYVRNELKNLGFVTDGSFHAELVKMSTDAFSELYVKMMSEDSKRSIKQRLVDLGVKSDTSINAILPHLLRGVSKSVAKGVFGKIGEDIADDCISFLSDNLSAMRDSLSNFFNPDSQ